MSGSESRKHPRVRPEPGAPVRVDIMGNGFLEVLSARDISVGGLGVSVKHKFEGCDIDSEVELIITLGRARPFKTRGVIRHASNDFFGVQFTSLSSDHARAIEAYVAARLGRRAAG